MLIRFRSYFNTAVKLGSLRFPSDSAAEQLFQRTLALHKQQTKTAAKATPNPQEAQALGEALTQQDLASFEKVLALLYNLYNQYQMSGGGGGPGAAMAAQAAAGGGMMQQQGGGMPMDPSMGGGAPPVDPNTGMPMDPAMMQQMMAAQGGGPPPGMMPPKMGSYTKQAIISEFMSSPENTSTGKVIATGAGGLAGGTLGALLGDEVSRKLNINPYIGGTLGGLAGTAGGASLAHLLTGGESPREVAARAGLGSITETMGAGLGAGAGAGLGLLGGTALNKLTGEDNPKLQLALSGLGGILGGIGGAYGGARLGTSVIPANAFDDRPTKKTAAPALPFFEANPAADMPSNIAIGAGLPIGLFGAGLYGAGALADRPGRVGDLIRDYTKGELSRTNALKTVGKTLGGIGGLAALGGGLYSHFRPRSHRELAERSILGKLTEWDENMNPETKEKIRRAALRGVDITRSVGNAADRVISPVSNAMSSIGQALGRG